MATKNKIEGNHKILKLTGDPPTDAALWALSCLYREVVAAMHRPRSLAERETRKKQKQK